MERRVPALDGLRGLATIMVRHAQDRVEVYPMYFEPPYEEVRYCCWFQSEVVVGRKLWGHVPRLVMHSQQFEMKTVP